MKFKGIKCPKCGKKGLGHPPHPHAYGYKEYGEVRCRFCKTRWKRENIEKYIETANNKEYIDIKTSYIRRTLCVMGGAEAQN